MKIIEEINRIKDKIDDDYVKSFLDRLIDEINEGRNVMKIEIILDDLFDMFDARSKYDVLPVNY